MSFNKNKSKESSKQKSSSTRQNFDLSTPFGDTTTSGKQITFDPSFFPGQQQGLDTASLNIQQLLGGFDPNQSAESALSGQVHQNNRQFLQAPILKRQRDSAKELQNQLASRNQLGGSLEALFKTEQQRQFGDQLDEADLQAGNLAIDIQNRDLTNQLALLTALRGDIGASVGQTLTPLQLALGAPEFNITGTQRGTAQGSSSPSILDRYNQQVQANARVVAAIIGG